MQEEEQTRDCCRGSQGAEELGGRQREPQGWWAEGERAGHWTLGEGAGLEPAEPREKIKCVIATFVTRETSSLPDNF